MSELPYMPSIVNLPKILARIKEAGAPPKFTHDFLKTSLGFNSSNDRSVLAILKKLGFLTSEGTPTDRYHEFRAGESGKRAITSGLREGWSEIFLADVNAQTKNSSQLTELFKTVTGKSESVSTKMATTFKALADQADWNASVTELPKKKDVEKDEDKIDDKEDRKDTDRSAKPSELLLTQDVHVHLPPSSDVAVYKAIFRALREELLD